MVVLANSVADSIQRAGQLRQIAVKYGISIEEVEKIIAEEILIGRQQVIDASGGYRPGVHIVEGEAADRVDPDVVKTVGSITKFENVPKIKGFQNLEKFAKEKALYIVPARLENTDLNSFKFVGYLRLEPTCAEAIMPRLTC